jgi:hypothetical protein
MQPEACMRAQAKLHEPLASPLGHIEGSQNGSVMLAEAISYAQAWHNVHSASSCSYNM